MKMIAEASKGWPAYLEAQIGRFAPDDSKPPTLPKLFIDSNGEFPKSEEPTIDKRLWSEFPKPCVGGLGCILEEEQNGDLFKRLDQAKVKYAKDQVKLSEGFKEFDFDEAR